ncbi:type I restriction-modification system methyltransferase subunit [Opitutaceae bacterium TAV1]|nr:type I restriction-modification system methyltransferase subunit [Opitutaceae bacterium TAV1]
MARRLSDSLIFDTLRLEGSLFIPAVLEKAARGEHTEQKTADYRLPKGLTLADEQGRAFRIASALHKTFDSIRVRKDVDAARATLGHITELLRDTLGYTDLTLASGPTTLADRAYPVTAFATGGRVPVIVAPHTLDLDTPDERFAIHGSGRRKLSAHQLAQQFLNASAACTWAILTNGRQLRLVRDADTLTRPAFLETDLDLILRARRYPDFAAVWRLFHASRAGAPDTPGDACIWETWKREGEAQGDRVREGLRDGVTDALLALGTGFLQPRDNEPLRQRFASGELTVEAYFQQLLRLVYRCLFLFTVEERGHLHVQDDSPDARHAREAYRQGYALRRLRDRSLRRAGFDRYTDLWTGIRIVFRGLAIGEPRLALPALGGLFAPNQCPDLDAATLENRALLTAMRHLRWSSATGSLAAVDYRNMDSEELGSIYESLLELIPTIDLPARAFGFVGLTDAERTDGNARKTSGSYYTPDSLVQELLDSALEPIIAQKRAAHPDDPARALLSITVIDPACGSGHFLLGAARRLAAHLAELRTTDGSDPAALYTHALREVIAKCIHGVDRNPMALELARTALWLEGYEPGLALSFLDHHLICGDALLGLADFTLLERGIPSDAFKLLAGDEKTVTKTLAVENRAALRDLERRRQGPDFFDQTDTTDLLAELRQLEALPDTTPGESEAKADAYAAFLQHARESRLAQAADLVVAAFLAPKATEADAARCPTTRTLADLLHPRQGAEVPAGTLAHARRLCAEARVLHWPLAFIDAFARGGFDCVLGNPPWERIKLQEEEFFANREPLVATAKNKAERAQRIQWLSEGSLAYHLQQVPLPPQGGHPAEIQLYRDFITARRVAEAMSIFAHVTGSDGGRYPLTGVGDVNTYALFAETITSITHASGRAGFIVPTGIATDDSTKDFFAHIAGNGNLVSLYDFENREKLFPAVDSRMKFALLTLGPADAADFAFFLTQTGQLKDARRHFVLTRDEFRLINPNTRTCPVFRSEADAELTKKIYRHVPVLIEEAHDEQPEKNPWGISFSTMFHMANDSGLFLDQPAQDAFPLYEAKMMHQFDHRWATYRWDAAKGEPITEDVTDAQKADSGFRVQPRYWVEERRVLSRLARVPRCITKAWDAQDPAALLAAFATWIVADRDDNALYDLFSNAARQRVIGNGGRLFEELPPSSDDWLLVKSLPEARTWPPLTDEELARLQRAPDILAAARDILDRRSPRWLMGWRDICRATDERTVIASVLPRTAVGHTLPLFFISQNPQKAAAMFGNWNSIVLDFVARQKVGGTHLTYSYLKQFPILSPEAYTEADLAYIVPRVLELTYTSSDLAAWASDLGYDGPPFAFNPERRAQLRSELDACYAKLYGLTREELCYILDPAETHGPAYPTVTFPGLKANELKAHGEYRTRRLVLAAWDNLGKTPVTATVTTPDVSLPAMPATARKNLPDDDSHWLLFVYHFLLRARGEATLPLIEEAWTTLIQRKQNSLMISNEIGDEQFRRWDASFNQEYPNRGFIQFLIQLHQNGWIDVSRGSWGITIPDNSLLLQNRPDAWRDYDAAVALRMALTSVDIIPETPAQSPVTTVAKPHAFIEAFELVA